MYLHQDKRYKYKYKKANLQQTGRKIMKTMKTKKKTQKSLIKVDQINERLIKGEAQTIGKEVERGNSTAEKVVATYVNWKRDKNEQTTKSFEQAYNKYKKVIRG